MKVENEQFFCTKKLNGTNDSKHGKSEFPHTEGKCVSVYLSQLHFPMAFQFQSTSVLMKMEDDMF